jgi:MFS family permease
VPPQILAHRAFVRATLTNFFFSLSLNGYVLLPLHVHALGGTEVAIGLVMGVYSAVGIVCQPLVGPWVDALGRRAFMIAGTALVLAASLLPIAFDSIGVFALVRALHGVGFSIYFVAMFSFVVDLVPATQRGWALGIFGVSGFVATAVAPLLGEWIVRSVGFRMLFVISAMLGAVPLALVLRLGRPHRARATAPAPGWMLAGLSDVLQRHMVVSLFFGLGSGTIFAFLPTFAQSLAVTTLSLFYTAYAAAAIAVRVFGGRLIDTHGRRAVIVPSMFLQASAPALLAVVGILVTRTSTVPVVPVLFLAGLLSGGAHGFLYPGLAALVTDLAPPTRRATSVGVFSAMFLVGQAGGAFVFGGVAHGLGYASMWTILAFSLLIGAALSMGLARPTPRRHATRPGILTADVQARSR